MECEKCKKEHDGSFGSGRFCSRKCANSRVWKKEDKLKKSISAKNSDKVTKRFRSKEEIEQFKQIVMQYREKIKEDLLKKDFKELSSGYLRKRLILEQKEKCNCCGIEEWMGQPISFEVEHKDGNSHNNERSNLEALCPNCHSQTKYWRGRNVKGRRLKIKDEELLDSFLEKGNIRQALLNVGLAAKGANYGRVKRVLALRGIEYTERV